MKRKKNTPQGQPDPNEETRRILEQVKKNNEEAGIIEERTKQKLDAILRQLNEPSSEGCANCPFANRCPAACTLDSFCPKRANNKPISFIDSDGDKCQIDSFFTNSVAVARQMSWTFYN